MKLQRFLIVIFFVYLLGFFAHALYLKKTVYGDGIYYYSWLRSISIDHDIDFRNEYAHFHIQQPTTTQQLPENKYAVGPALLWFPTFLWIHAFARGDGYHLWYQLTTGITSVFVVLIGLLLLFRLLHKYFSQTISIASVLAIAFATNLFFYGSLDTVNSHGLSFFAACLYLSLIFAKNKQYGAIGTALALIGLIRAQDLIYGILLIPYLRKSTIISIARGFSLFFLPQLLAWQLLYGKFWVSPYLSGGEGFFQVKPHVLEVLFSIQNGLITWTPIIAVGFVGLWLNKMISKSYRVIFILLILLQLMIVANWSTWWQGASYSGRMFVSLLPIFAFGLAAIFTRLQIYKWTISYYLLCIIGPLTVINMLLMIFFLLHKNSL